MGAASRSTVAAPASTPVPVDEHRRAVLGAASELPVMAVPLQKATGLYLADDVAAAVALPLWHNSAMDGYAVRAADTAGAAPGSAVELRIIGEVAAGDGVDPRLERGTAVRIMTGAPVPRSADAVIPVEQTVADVVGAAWAEHRVLVQREVVPGTHVRRRGEDAAVGSLLAHSGERLGARRIAALAAAGVSEVSVRRRPRVAVIATGAELHTGSGPFERGQIPESNSVLIAGLLAEEGIEPVSVSVCDDDAEGFAARLAELAGEVDAVITTGGVGPGLHDIVRIALAIEPDVRAVRVAVKPGQPQCFGRLRGGPIFGHAYAHAARSSRLGRHPGPAAQHAEAPAGGAQGGVGHRCHGAPGRAERWLHGRFGPVFVRDARLARGGRGPHGRRVAGRGRL